MKTAILLLSMLTFAATIAMAQTTTHSNYAFSSGNQPVASASQSGDLRGCLSGSKGNYTLLDHQGKSHKVVGDNRELGDDVGHEVELTGKPNSGNAFQEAEITDIASRCWNFKLK
jgi:hypothetical protein